MSSASFDLGSLPAAVQLARTSALYGEVIGHGPLQAYAHGTLAYLAYWDSRPSEAVRLAQAAQQFGGTGHTAGVRLATIAGRAHAHCGDRAAAQRAMRALDEENTTGRHDDLHDGIGGEFAMPPARAAMSTATTHLVLRDGQGAEQAAIRALALLDAGPPAEQPTLRGKAAVDLARARLLRGEVEGALDAVEPVFGLQPEWRTLGLLERMAALRADLAHRELAGAAAARDMGERMEEFTVRAAGRGLGGASPLALGP